MTVSRLTKSEPELWADFLADQGGVGSHLTMSAEKLLAAIRNTYGGNVSHLTMNRERLLASIATAAGTSTSALLKREERLLVDLNVGLGGTDSDLTKSFTNILEDCANVDTGGGGGGYVAKAITFPTDGGSNKLTQTDGYAGADDYSLTLSGWYKTDNISIAPDVMVGLSNAGFFADTFELEIGFNYSSDIGFAIRNTNDGGESIQRFGIGSNDGLFILNAWHHIFLVIDTNHLAGSKIGYLYVDGVSVADPGNIIDSDGIIPIDFNGSKFTLNNNIGNPGNASFCDVQAWYGQFIDPTNPDNLEKFISGGKPVDPAIAAAAFGQQTILLSGDATGFQTNQGSSSSEFTLTGSITNATTSPSD